MTYDLFIGDRTFSSWSLRGWLMLAKFDLPVRAHLVGLYAGTLADDLADLYPAKLVPALRTPDGDIIGESLAIAETLAERHPDRGLWPTDPSLRIRARWLCAEMVSGFATLRSECPMQLEYINQGFVPSDALRRDLDRLDMIWTRARALSGHESSWLFGDYCLADVFFAPVAARVIGYNLPLSTQGRAYCEALTSDPAFLNWQRQGREITYDPFPYPTFPPLKPWPVT